MLVTINWLIALISHSVETPSVLDPQWNILYWGSKWIVITVCRGAFGCEWGTISVYFGITYVWFVPIRFPVFAVEPQYQYQIVLFLPKASFGRHTQNLKKNPCRFKTWMGFVGQILIKLGTSSIWGFLLLPVWCNLCKHAGGHSVTTEACTPSHPTCLCLCGIEVWKLIWAICAMVINWELQNTMISFKGKIHEVSLHFTITINLMITQYPSTTLHGFPWVAFKSHFVSNDSLQTRYIFINSLLEWGVLLHVYPRVILV